jgi:hypothetical protein
MAATEFTAEGAYRLGCPPRFRTRWTQHLRWLPMRQLMETEDLGELQQNARHGFGRRKGPTDFDSYAQGWYAVHYFNEDSARQQQLARYLELVGSGTSSEQAVKQAFKLDYAQLDVALQAHAQQETFPCIEVQPRQADALPAPDVQPISKAEAHYRVGQLLLLSQFDNDAAREALDTALALEPRHAGALGALARVYLRAGEEQVAEGVDGEPSFARADQLLRDARAIEPNDAERFGIEGHIALARANAALERNDKAAALAALATARTAYRKAVKRDETLPEALVGLGVSYLMIDDGAEEGQVALEGAAYLLPLYTDIALALGRLHLARKQPKEALAPLAHAQRWARDEAERQEVQGLIDDARIAAGGKAR